MISIAYALLISLVLVLATVIIHYEVLTTTAPVAARLPLSSLRARMLWMLAGIFFAHLVEITLYGVAYYLMEGHLGLGTISGATAGEFMDFFYFSAVSYTTLGFGDVYPSGPVRIVVGIESLNGLVLIGWSTSYTYLLMQRLSRIARQSAREGPEG